MIGVTIFESMGTGAIANVRTWNGVTERTTRDVVVSRNEFGMWMVVATASFTRRKGLVA